MNELSFGIFKIHSCSSCTRRNINGPPGLSASVSHPLYGVALVNPHDYPVVLDITESYERVTVRDGHSDPWCVKSSPLSNYQLLSMYEIGLHDTELTIRFLRRRTGEHRDTRNHRQGNKPPPQGSILSFQSGKSVFKFVHRVSPFNLKPLLKVETRRPRGAV